MWIVSRRIELIVDFFVLSQKPFIGISMAWLTLYVHTTMKYFNPRFDVCGNAPFWSIYMSPSISSIEINTFSVIVLFSLCFTSSFSSVWTFLLLTFFCIVRPERFLWRGLLNLNIKCGCTCYLPVWLRLVTLGSITS